MAFRWRDLVTFFGILCVTAAAAPFDLDVDLPTGSPFDSIKIPKETPTGGRPGDTTSGGGKVERPDQGPNDRGEGSTVAEEPKKVPPPKPPSGLPGVQAPSTVDYQKHLGWKPDDKSVDWKDPLGPATPTGDGKSEPKDPGVWDMRNYPPKVPNDLYVYAVCRFLMVMLHKAQVSESELTEFLIEMGYPAHYAATATKNETRLKTMAQIVMNATGPMIKSVPPKPSGEIAQKVHLDLVAHFPYEPEFGQYTLSRPSGETLPVLLEILNTSGHPFLKRNAVFILRCYNNPEIVPVLRRLLTTTSDKVIRNRALAALVRWQDLETAEWLGARLKGPDTFRVYAAWALGRIGAPAQIDNVISAAKLIEPDGEFLLSAVPALGRLGRVAVGDRKQKVQSFLEGLNRQLPAVKDPEPWGGTGGLQTKMPEPANIRQKIIGERIRIAQAFMEVQSEVDWIKRLGRNPYGKVHITNIDLINETLDVLEGRDR